jgi:NADH:ubiquinone oxidoreductase subunit E
VNDELLRLIQSFRDDFLGVDQTTLIACLKAIQSQYGEIPAEAIDMMVQELNTTPGILKSLILRIPSLKMASKVHTILMCNGERCSNRGAEAFIRTVETTLKTRVGEKTPDGLFILKTQRCLGRCAFGKNVNLDDQALTEMTLEKLLVAIELIKKGTH